MDEVIIYIIVFLLVGGIQLFNAIVKGKKGQNNGKGKDFNKKSTPSQQPQSQREIYKQLGLEDLYEQLQNKNNPGQRPAEKKPAEPQLTLREERKQTKEAKPENRELTLREERLKRQEAEEKRKAQEKAFLDREIKRSQSSHFSEDRVISEIESAHAKGKEMAHHRHNYNKEGDDVYEADYHKEYELPETGAAKKSHPIKKRFNSARSIREAFIMKELFERKY